MGQSAKRKNVIGNFYPDLVNMKVMRAFTKKNKIEIEDSADATAEQYAVALTQHFREVEKDPNEFAACETCGGESPAVYDACPFCGLEAGAEDDEDATDEDATDEDATDEDDAQAADADESDDAPESAPAVKQTKRAKAEKPTKAAKAEKTKPNLALVKSGSTAMSVKLLDDAVGRVIALKVEGAEAFWKLGHEILLINRDGLWKQRVSEDGKQRYASFEAFCTHELNISGTYAFNIMGVARDMTLDQIKAMGRKKSILVWKAAPEDRKEIAEKAASGATVRELEPLVAESRKKHKVAEKSERSRAGAKGAKAKAERAPKEDKITVAKVEGLRTVKLYAKPATLKNLDLDECKRAEMSKVVNEAIAKVQPFGRFELANGVAMYFSIIVDKGGALAVKVNTVRESPVA